MNNKNKTRKNNNSNKNTSNIPLSVEHTAGFFSTCSVYLDAIIKYVNKHHKLPKKINTDRLFEWYKPEGKKESIVTEYFKNSPESIKYTHPINYRHELQYTDYNTLDYKSLNPYIKKYFTPVDPIIENIHNMVNDVNETYGINHIMNLDNMRYFDTNTFKKCWK
jgi:hypothetical protein